MRFNDIPQVTRDGRYQVDVPWSYLTDQLTRWDEDRVLNLDPDFQREHVWTDTQRTAYLEAKLRGAVLVDIIRFNCTGWPRSAEPVVLVDGKQRLETVRRFLAGEVTAFGQTYEEFGQDIPFDIGFRFHVNDLPDRAAVLRWYLELNAGGTPHSDAELNRVRELLELHRSMENRDLAKRIRKAMGILAVAGKGSDRVNMAVSRIHEHECGTVACFGGWYAVARQKDDPEIFGGKIDVADLDYFDGVNVLAADLGFHDYHTLKAWFHDRPELWGNENADDMFSAPEAFGICDGGALTLRHVIDHWLGVAFRLEATA